jgi:hypothetical protein
MERGEITEDGDTFCVTFGLDLNRLVL